MDEKNNVASNFLWKLMERCGAQCVSLVVSVILARLLEPEVYGAIALITILTSFLAVFVRSGMASSLIQKKNTDNLDFSTVFFFNVATSIILYVLLFALAPLIASFYGDAALTAMIRVSSLTLLASGVKNVLEAKVSKQMMFRKFFFATLIGTIAAACCGIWMAYRGFGVWALVMQYLVNDVIDTIVLWIVVKWHPSAQFSLERLKGLLKFGWKLLVSTLIDAVYTDIRQLIIGKIYTSSDLAFYNRGNQFPALINTNVNVSIDSVLFPTMSKVQDDKDKIKGIVKRSIKTSTYILAPLLVGLAAVSKQFIQLLLTEKWFPCIPYLCVFCATFLFCPIQTANLNAIKAIGRSDICLKLELTRKGVATVIIIGALWFGPLAICIGELIAAFLHQFIIAAPNKKLIGYGFIEQIIDIFPSIILSIVMGGTVWMIGRYIAAPTILLLLMQVIVGIIVYIAGSIIFRFDSFYYVFDIAKDFIIRRKKR